MAPSKSDPNLIFLVEFASSPTAQVRSGRIGWAMRVAEGVRVVVEGESYTTGSFVVLSDTVISTEVFAGLKDSMLAGMTAGWHIRHK